MRTPFFPILRIFTRAVSGVGTVEMERSAPVRSFSDSLISKSLPQERCNFPKYAKKPSVLVVSTGAMEPLFNI